LSKKTTTTTKKKILNFIAKVWKNIDSNKPEDTKYKVHCVSSVDEILLNDEKIIWQGSPLAKYSWGDHDMLEPVGSSFDQPKSILARTIVNIFATLFVIFVTIAGVVFILAGIEELLLAQNFGKYFGGGLMFLMGSTLVSSISLLFTPFINMQRANKMQYLITNKRCLVIRKGYDWHKVWGKSPIIFTVSLLFLFGVLGFAIILFVWFFLGC